MQGSKDARIVLVTCGSRAEARKVAEAVVAKGIAACATIVSTAIESVYRWEGKVQRAREFQLVIKTRAARLEALEAQVTRLHSYDVPEILVLSVSAGSRKYLEWLKSSTR